MAAQQQQQQHQQQSKQHINKLPVELQNMVNFYTPTKDILQSREAQEMLMGMHSFSFFNFIILFEIMLVSYFHNRNKTW